jgi:leader peptidase (prepilin peptidase) / N-methyltransferase
MEKLLEFSPSIFGCFWLILVFLLGASIGSLLNVCIYRLPLEKSILWPGSRCGVCLQPIQFRDNLPLIGYLILRGKCRSCKTSYSSRYFWIELLTGLIFATLFYFEILTNIHGHAVFNGVRHQMEFGVIPGKAWLYFLHHAVLISLLLIAAVCDLDGMTIPLPVTMTGTLIGLIFSAMLPWPWPEAASVAQSFQTSEDWLGYVREPKEIPFGRYPWPFWGPLPGWLAPGSTLLGLSTGLVGAIMGMMLARAIKFVFEQGLGKEALGLGDADLMMMAGAFLGWQITVIGFFVGSIVSLFLAIPTYLFQGKRLSPFGPGLAIGFIITEYLWPTFGPMFRPFFFDEFMLGILIVFLGLGLFSASLILRVFSRPEDEVPPTSDSTK